MAQDRPVRPQSSRDRVLLALGLAIAAVAVIASGALAGHHHSKPPQPALVSPTSAGPGGVAAAYRYPLSCLTVTISASDPAYASARLNRASPCWRYGVYLTAIFHRVDGSWREVLDANAYACPLVWLPAVVQVQLSVCPPKARGRPARVRRD